MQEVFSFLCWPLFPEYFPGMHCGSISYAPMHMDRGQPSFLSRVQPYTSLGHSSENLRQ